MRKHHTTICLTSALASMFVSGICFGTVANIPALLFNTWWLNLPALIIGVIAFASTILSLAAIAYE